MVHPVLAVMTAMFLWSCAGEVPLPAPEEPTPATAVAGEGEGVAPNVNTTEMLSAVKANNTHNTTLPYKKRQLATTINTDLRREAMELFIPSSLEIPSTEAEETIEETSPPDEPETQVETVDDPCDWLWPLTGSFGSPGEPAYVSATIELNELGDTICVLLLEGDDLLLPGELWNENEDDQVAHGYHAFPAEECFPFRNSEGEEFKRLCVETVVTESHMAQTIFEGPPGALEQTTTVSFPRLP